MRSVPWGPCLVILAAASCGSPSPSPPADGGGPGDADPGFGLELLAGDTGGPGNVDGTGAAAHFNGPRDVAVDGEGNVYVADLINSTLRKVTPAGVVTTLAGTAGQAGSADGTGSDARFFQPTGVAADGAGNVYVADSFNDTVRKITPAGVVTTLAGAPGPPGSADGTGAAARFDLPRGVAVDGAGNVYVADAGNHTLRKITPAGVVTTLAGTAGQAGSADGVGAAARFDFPSDVSVDGEGNVYVFDTNNSTVRKVTPAGVVTTLAGAAGMADFVDGTGPAARFGDRVGGAVDSAGNVYVADQNTVRKITRAGVVTTLAGSTNRSGSADGTGAAARFDFAFGVAVDGAGNAYVADQLNSTIRKITPAGVVTTLAGSAKMFGSADGTGAEARFNLPAGVAVDSSGNLYVADQNNHTVRKITPAGVVTTLAGAAGTPGSADGTGTAARFKLPVALAVDGAGNVCVVDQGNHTIRKVTPGGVVTTLAGMAEMMGSADGTGAAARFNSPYGLALDGAGNVYVADAGNATVRRVTPGGVVTTLAGMAGMTGSADGTGAAARFGLPVGLAIDSAGNVYVADPDNSTIRKVTPTGTTTTVAGTPGAAGILLGATPRLSAPGGVAISGDSLVVTDTNAILLLRHGARE